MKISEIIHPLLDEVILVKPDLVQFDLLKEGKTIPGRFPTSIRIDQATHLNGNANPHAHVFGRRGDELGVVNFNGTGSHSSKFKLHAKDAAALRAQGFEIRSDNLVEWIVIDGVSANRILLLG